VIGVSSDTAEAHRRFADQNQLAFPLLEDEGGRMRKAWGVPRTMGILPGRVTYVLDSSLVVHSIFNSQLEPSRHVEAALAVLDRLDRRPASRRRHRTRKSGK
ncbi:MAG: redoxin domain-containing protein, partial [Planctomycetota bacterium]|jgi:peroxiredoxin Q/BCP|nr:redoxin domain-containing protein [Planctomycetota bacterium]